MQKDEAIGEVSERDAGSAHYVLKTLDPFTQFVRGQHNCPLAVQTGTGSAKVLLFYVFTLSIVLASNFYLYPQPGVAVIFVSLNKAVFLFYVDKNLKILMQI